MTTRCVYGPLSLSVERAQHTRGYEQTRNRRGEARAARERRSSLAAGSLPLGSMTSPCRRRALLRARVYSPLVPLLPVRRTIASPPLDRCPTPSRRSPPPGRSPLPPLSTFESQHVDVRRERRRQLEVGSVTTFHRRVFTARRGEFERGWRGGGAVGRRARRWGTPLRVSPMGEWAPAWWGGRREWGEGMEAPLLVLFSFFLVSPSFVVPVSFSTPMHPCSASLLLPLLLPLIEGGDAYLHSRQPHTGFTGTVYPLERCNVLSS